MYILYESVLPSKADEKPFGLHGMLVADVLYFASVVSFAICDKIIIQQKICFHSFTENIFRFFFNTHTYPYMFAWLCIKRYVWEFKHFCSQPATFPFTILSLFICHFILRWHVIFFTLFYFCVQNDSALFDVLFFYFIHRGRKSFSFALPYGSWN